MRHAWFRTCAYAQGATKAYSSDMAPLRLYAKAHAACIFNYFYLLFFSLHSLFLLPSFATTGMFRHPIFKRPYTFVGRRIIVLGGKSGAVRDVVCEDPEEGS